MRTFLLILVCVCGALCQTPPRIEVVSVKASYADPSNSGVTTGHGRIHAQNVTLRRCIMGAWSVGPNQIVGGPDWLNSDRFEIEARADQPVDDDATLSVLLRGILADRFKLALHHETRPIEAYVLEVAKNGPKMQSSSGGESVDLSHNGGIDSKNVTMQHFAEVLSRQMDLPVVNRTGLAGQFNLKLQWTPEYARQNADAGPTIYTAIQEQLGLRLRAEKTPIDVLVIDHIEKPSEN
jgi:uncharacterized protein (TIGR03435 family)